MTGLKHVKVIGEWPRWQKAHLVFFLSPLLILLCLLAMRGLFPFLLLKPKFLTVVASLASGMGSDSVWYNSSKNSCTKTRLQWTLLEATFLTNLPSTRGTPFEEDAFNFWNRPWPIPKRRQNAWRQTGRPKMTWACGPSCTFSVRSMLQTWAKAQAQGTSNLIARAPEKSQRKANTPHC